MIIIQARVFMCNILTTFQLNEAFLKVIIQNDVTDALFSYQMKFIISTSRKFYKSYLTILNVVFNAIKKM